MIQKAAWIAKYHMFEARHKKSRLFKNKQRHRVTTVLHFQVELSNIVIKEQSRHPAVTDKRVDTETDHRSGSRK